MYLTGSISTWAGWARVRMTATDLAKDTGTRELAVVRFRLPKGEPTDLELARLLVAQLGALLADVDEQLRQSPQT